MGDKLCLQPWLFYLFIVSRTPSIQKFKAYILAKVHNFVSEIIKKSGRETFTTLCGFGLFVTDSKIY